MTSRNTKLFVGLWVGLTLVAGGGIFALIYALLGRNTPAVIVVTSTPAQVSVVSVTPVQLPTVTSVPPTREATFTPVATVTPAITATPTVSTTTRAASVTLTATAVLTSTTPSFQITLGANVRNGPGTSYTVIGGLEQGDVAEAIGRDAAGKWLVIRFARGKDQQGWVSSQVGTYTGTINDLPVIAAPPLPPTPIPPTAAPTVKPSVSGKGLTGQLTLCQSKTTYASGERVCFIEKIVNTTANFVPYGVLGVLAVGNNGVRQFQTSWSGDLGINAGCTGPTDKCGGVWEDGIRLNTPGTYTLFLNICYSPLSACLSGGEWELLTSGLAITIQ